MTVSVDGVATAAASSSSATSITNTNLTVGVGATALFACIIFDEVTAVASAATVNWDNTGTPQAMTLLTSIQSASVNVEIRLFGLVNPTPGNLTLSASWSTGAVPVVLDAMSFNATVNTTVANAFLHAGTNSGTTGTPTITITSAVGNYICSAAGARAGLTSWTATGSTALFTYTSPNSENFRALYAPGAATLASTAGTTSTEWAAAGVDIVAATFARKFVPYKQWYGAILAR